jgi:hypothetical protein
MTLRASVKHIVCIEPVRELLRASGRISIGVQNG